MRRLTTVVIFALLILCGTSQDHDHEEEDHEEDGDHEDDGDHAHHYNDIFISDHQESLVDQCTSSGGKYCFDQNESEHCYKNANAAYCQCTDGVDGTWDASSSSCTSMKRSECFQFKESLYSFYGGVCYTNVTCKESSSTANPWTWIDGDTASCSPVEARCAAIADSEWDDSDASNKTCKCLEAGAVFHNTHCHSADVKASTGEKWGYGIIATAIISAFAVIGVLIVLMRHQWWYPLLLSTMVALAMGCLLSDATLHLIPLSLGIHSHDEEEAHVHAAAPSASDHGDEEEEMSASQRRGITIAITLGVYLFLLFEKLIHIVIPHQHSHGGEVVSNPVNGADTELKAVHGKNEDVVTRDGSICSVDTVAWMVIIGDAMHNFADGLVMGAAFTNSLATGLGTSIAVFCHEVPHELGDFAVLLNAGMKIKFAVLFNFLSACTCFLGLFVGLAIGENETAQKWIFAFTAGMFIYISCADLIPEMNSMCNASKYPKACFVLQQVGAMVGFLIMLLIAIYEGDLENISGGGHNH